MLTIETALKYAARIATGYTFHDACEVFEDGVHFVRIDLRRNGEPAGQLDVWVENGACCHAALTA